MPRWLTQLTTAIMNKDCEKMVSIQQQIRDGPGSGWAYTFLGYIAERGECVPRDFRKAAEFYRMAIRHYSGDALILLGRLHLTGSGVEQDIEQAKQLFRSGVLHLIHIDPAQRYPTRFIYLYSGIPPELIGSSRWLNSLPDDTESLLAMARALRSGDGFRRDLRSAYLWYREAARKGSVEALHEMAIMMIDESGARRDLSEGARYLREAAGMEYGPAQFELGKRLARGDGGKPQYRFAYYWLLRAADNGIEVKTERDSVAAELWFLDRVMIRREARKAKIRPGRGLIYNWPTPDNPRQDSTRNQDP